MEDVTRRDAVKLVATGAAVTGLALAGSNAGARAETHAQPYRDESAKRWEGHKTASPDDLKDLQRNTSPVPVKIGVDPPVGGSATSLDTDAINRLKADLAPLGVQPVSADWVHTTSGPQRSTGQAAEPTGNLPH